MSFLIQIATAGLVVFGIPLALTMYALLRGVGIRERLERRTRRSPPRAASARTGA